MPEIEIARLGVLAYHDIGSGPAVVFLHSALMDSRQWDREVDEISKQYRVIAVDLPGFGQSDNPQWPFDPAQPVFSLMDHLGVREAHWVGSSLGGSIAIHAAVHSPQRVLSLFLAGTGMFGFNPEITAHEPSVYRQYEVAWEARDMETVVNIGAAIWLDGLSSSPIPERVRQSFMTAYRDRLLNHPWDNPPFVSVNDQDAVLHLEPPTMVVIGEHDTAYCRALADWLGRSVPAVNLYEMQGAAHFPNLSRPEEFRQVLWNWLKDYSA